MENSNFVQIFPCHNVNLKAFTLEECNQNLHQSNICQQTMKLPVITETREPNPRNEQWVELKLSVTDGDYWAVYDGGSARLDELA